MEIHCHCTRHAPLHIAYTLDQDDLQHLWIRGGGITLKNLYFSGVILSGEKVTKHSVLNLSEEVTSEDRTGARFRQYLRQVRLLHMLLFSLQQLRNTKTDLTTVVDCSSLWLRRAIVALKYFVMKCRMVVEWCMSCKYSHYLVVSLDKSLLIISARND
jgi:hypothetical protein